MGHLRLGRLPKTRHWQAVVELLESDEPDVQKVASAAIEAAEERLRQLSKDPSLAYCYWLLTRIAWASRGQDFAAALSDLGVQVDRDAPALTALGRIADHAQAEISQHTGSGAFGEFASLALRRALTETIGQHNPSLFGSSLDDIQSAFRNYSTRDKFGVLAKRYFADFLSRTLRYFIDKELANCTGGSGGISDLHDIQQFTQSLDLYGRQSASIMEDFAAGWYAKHNWESAGQVSREEAQGFVDVALRKLRMELKREGHRGD